MKTDIAIVGAGPAGIFTAVEMLRLGSTKNMIVGHDHVNSSSMVVDGIRLSYGLKCGSGCYWEPEMSGGSTLTISSDGTGTFAHVYIAPA